MDRKNYPPITKFMKSSKKVPSTSGHSLDITTDDSLSTPASRLPYISSIWIVIHQILPRNNLMVSNGIFVFTFFDRMFYVLCSHFLLLLWASLLFLFIIAQSSSRKWGVLTFSHWHHIHVCIVHELFSFTTWLLNWT